MQCDHVTDSPLGHVITPCNSSREQFAGLSVVVEKRKKLE